MIQPKLISFSGGRSSAMMLKIMLDNGLIEHDFDVVGFANTGKEMPETLDFIYDITRYWGIKIWWVEYLPHKPLYQIVDYETAARNGEPFEALLERGHYLPNAAQRICTGDLKVKPLNRLMKRHLGYKRFTKYMGIRFDEKTRYLNNKDTSIMPLYDMQITKQMVRDFWAAQPFDLQIADGWGNCDLCFQKGRAYTGKLVKLIRQDPDRADWWIEMEKKSGAHFINAISYSELKYIALNQLTLDFEALEEIPDTFDCKCGG